MKPARLPSPSRSLPFRRALLFCSIPLLAACVLIALARAGDDKPGDLGAILGEVSPEVAALYGYEGGGGAFVVEVAEDGPANQKGMQEGDIIVKYEGHPVLSAAELNGQIRRAGAGFLASIHVWRDGSEKWLGLVTLAARPEPIEMSTLAPVIETVPAHEEAITALRAEMDTLRQNSEELERKVVVLRVEVKELKSQVRELRDLAAVGAGER